MITALTLRACPTDIEPRCHVSIFIIDRLYILLQSFSLSKTLSIYFHTRSYYYYHYYLDSMTRSIHSSMFPDLELRED